MYLDTSVIVKLLVPEPDSDAFNKLVSGQPTSTSELALVEVRSALLARERNHQLTEDERERAWRVFQTWNSSGQIEVRPLNRVVMQKSISILSACHPSAPLRALDAIHCAACDLSQDFPLCTNDARMRAAAESLGIPVIPKTPTS